MGHVTLTRLRDSSNLENGNFRVRFLPLADRVLESRFVSDLAMRSMMMIVVHAPCFNLHSGISK